MKASAVEGECNPYSFSEISHTGFGEAYIRAYLATCSNSMQTFTTRPSRYGRSGEEQCMTSIWMFRVSQLR